MFVFSFCVLPFWWIKMYIWRADINSYAIYQIVPWVTPNLYFKVTELLQMPSTYIVCDSWVSCCQFATVTDGQTCRIALVCYWASCGKRRSLVDTTYFMYLFSLSSDTVIVIWHKFLQCCSNWKTKLGNCKRHFVPCRPAVSLLYWLLSFCMLHCWENKVMTMKCWKLSFIHTTLFAIKGSNNKKNQRKRSEINHCKISQTQQDNTIQ